MKPVRPFKTGLRNLFRSACRPAYRPRASLRSAARTTYRCAVRLGLAASFWRPPANAARVLCTLVGQILQFHEKVFDPQNDPAQWPSATSLAGFG